MVQDDLEMAQAETGDLRLKMEAAVIELGISQAWTWEAVDEANMSTSRANAEVAALET